MIREAAGEDSKMSHSGVRCTPVYTCSGVVWTLQSAMEPFFFLYSKPYGGRQKYDGKNSSPESRPSVFWRLGASASNSAGSVFSRLSGLGGGEKFSAKGSSWHKITVS